MHKKKEEVGCVLAFDFGLKHIGTAVGQTITQTASPLKTLPAKNGAPRWSSVQTLIEQWQPVRLLVGLPYNMDGSENFVCTHARDFAAELERRFGLPVTLVDERLTTREAMERSNGDVDASHNIAAALIAESYLR